MNNLIRLDQDFSAKSMGILSKKVRTLFAEQMPDANVWMPDTYELPASTKGKITDVVFFGDFFRKFLETGNWTPERYRMWCLGEPTKKFLTQLAGFNADQVSILPRDLLFRTLPASYTPDLSSEAVEFIYAGRLTASKRILTMIWSVFHLQELGFNVTLSLYGEFFQEEKFCDCPGLNPYQDRVISLVSGLKWKTPPKIFGKVGSQEWLKYEPARKPVYYSLSVLPFEDFSVSVAQAQESGWPCILSNWGAHKDISGTVMKLPLQLFQKIPETDHSSESEGKMIAAYIASKKFSVSSSSVESFSIPEFVSLTDFDEHRRKFLNKWGMGLQDVIRHRTDDLKGSSEWEAFMKEYLKCFM